MIQLGSGAATIPARKYVRANPHRTAAHISRIITAKNARSNFRFGT
jgi:hypothetical protein